MAEPLRVLLVADSDRPAESIEVELSGGGYESDIVRVDTIEAVGAALASGGWDAVLADAGMDALPLTEIAEALEERDLDLPLIAMAERAEDATIGAAMEAGAHGFVTRAAMERLLPALKRELARARQRAAGRQAIDALAENEHFKESVFSSILDGISVLDKNFVILCVNPAMEKWYAHAMPLAGKKCYEAYHGRDVPCDVCPSRETLETGTAARETVPRIGPGGVRAGWLDLYSFPLVEKRTGRLTGVIEYVRDITEHKRVVDALRESEARYRSFVESFSGIAFRGRMNFVPIFFHGAVGEITGYTEADFLGGHPTWNDVIYPEDRERLRESFEKVRSVPGWSGEREYRIVRKDGDVRWIREFVKNVCDSFGKPVYVEGTMYDVTKQKQVEEALRKSEEYFRLLAENAQDIIYRYRLKPTPGFEFVSPSATRIVGYTPEEHYADPELGAKIVHPDDRTLLDSALNSPSGANASVTLRWIAKDGGIVWTEQHNVLIRDARGQVVAIEGVARDVTERRRIEELKSDLIAMVSHELRAPLASIVGYSTLLAREGIAENKPLYDKSVGKIHELATHMNDLIESLLEATKIQSGHLQLQLDDTDVEELVRGCVDRVLMPAPGAVVFQTAPDGVPRARCDRKQLSWAVTNIVSNADKFSPDGAPIHVGIDSSHGRVRIAVRDEGIGIARRDLDHIFDRFSQADMSSARPAGGFGMGLYTAKAIVEAHGGRIDVATEIGKGSTFTIEIPVAGPSASRDAP